MSSSISELLPSISALSQQDKFRLVQLVLAQLAQESKTHIPEPPEPFDPEKFRGVMNESKETID